MNATTWSSSRPTTGIAASWKARGSCSTRRQAGDGDKAAWPDLSIDPALMVGPAAFAPLALGIDVLLEGVIFIVLRLRSQHNAAILGALWLYVGCVVSTGVWTALAVSGISHSG